MSRHHRGRSVSMLQPGQVVFCAFNVIDSQVTLSGYIVIQLLLLVIHIMRTLT